MAKWCVLCLMAMEIWFVFGGLEAVVKEKEEEHGSSIFCLRRWVWAPLL